MLTLEVVTPTKRVVAPVKVEFVTLTGAHGELTILPGHARLVSSLETGVLRYEVEGSKEKHAAVLSSGFVEVKNDKVTVLAETLEMAREIDVERAKKAQTKAEERLKDKELDPDSFRKYQLKIQRALIRQQLSRETAGH
jgi:F-type H+-transporting ATPase subunit epsilon